MSQGLNVGHLELVGQREALYRSRYLFSGFLGRIAYWDWTGLLGRIAWVDGKGWVASW